jgi:hypothetical protein
MTDRVTIISFTSVIIRLILTLSSYYQPQHNFPTHPPTPAHSPVNLILDFFKTQISNPSNSSTVWIRWMSFLSFYGSNSTQPFIGKSTGFVWKGENGWEKEKTFQKSHQGKCESERQRDAKQEHGCILPTSVVVCAQTTRLLSYLPSAGRYKVRTQLERKVVSCTDVMFRGVDLCGLATLFDEYEKQTLRILERLSWS